MAQKLRLNRLEEPPFRPVDEENEPQRAPEVWSRPHTIGGKANSDWRLNCCQRSLDTGPRGLYTSGLGHRRSGLAAPHSTYYSSPAPRVPTQTLEYIPHSLGSRCLPSPLGLRRTLDLLHPVNVSGTYVRAEGRRIYITRHICVLRGMHILV